MNQGSGWIGRIFGATAELEQRFRRASVALAEKDRRINELERQLEFVGGEAAEKARKALELERQAVDLRDAAQLGSSRAGEQEKQLMEALTRAEHERVALDTTLADMTSKLAETEASLKSKVEREGALGNAIAMHTRRADQLASEVEATKKQLAQAASTAEAALNERARLTAALAARDAELTEKADLVSAAEWKIATLESELADARSELKRATHDHALQVDSMRRDQARTAIFVEQRQTLLAQTREALFDVLRLSASALDRTLGVATHLAIELAAASCPRKHPKTPHDALEAVIELRNRLALIGVAEEFTAKAEGAGYTGRFKITMAVPELEYAGLARWVAAYAIEALNDTTAEPLRLEVLEGGPAEFHFLATPRRPAPLASNMKPAQRDNKPPEAPPPELGHAI